MDQPDGFVDTAHLEYVCKLRKAVYGLKQAPRAWFNTIQPVLFSIGVNLCPGDNGVFSGTVQGLTVLIAV